MRDGEVVWVVPFWSQATNLNMDSNYTYLRQMLPAMLEARPAWLFVVSWPMKSVGVNWHYINDGLFDEPRIMRAGWPYDSQMRSSVLTFDPRRFEAIDSRYGPTTYWLHQVESGAQMFGGYRQSFAQPARPVMIAQQHFIVHQTLSRWDTLFPRLWAQIGGALASDAVVLNSQYTARMMNESFSEYLNAEQMHALGEKSVVLPFGLRDGRFDAAIAAREAEPLPTKPIVVYNHRLEWYKQVDQTADVLNALRASGRDFEVWATQLRDQRAKGLPIDRAVGHPDADVYLRNIAVPAINTVNSMHETFCISAFESVALGHLLVAPNGITFPELVPAGYPFLFDTLSEQRAMLADIIDTWPKRYLEWRDRLREFAAEKFDFKRYVESYCMLIDAHDRVWAHRDQRAPIERAMSKIVRELPNGVYPLDRLTAQFQRATNAADHSLPPRRVVREAVRRGMTLTVTSDRQGDAIALRKAGKVKAPSPLAG